MRFFLRFLPSRDRLAIQPIRWLLLSRLCANLFFSRKSTHIDPSEISPPAEYNK